MGSLRNVVDNTGAVLGTISYDGFGNSSQSSPTNSGLYLWDGYRYDAETGFYRPDPTRGRYYLPVIGRWNGVDPIGFGGGDANLWRYVGNNATNFSDPSGLWKYRIWIEGTTYQEVQDPPEAVIGQTRAISIAKKVTIYFGPGLDTTNLRLDPGERVQIYTSLGWQTIREVPLPVPPPLPKLLDKEQPLPPPKINLPPDVAPPRYPVPAIVEEGPVIKLPPDIARGQPDGRLQSPIPYTPGIEEITRLPTFGNGPARFSPLLLPPPQAEWRQYIDSSGVHWFWGPWKIGVSSNSTLPPPLLNVPQNQLPPLNLAPRRGELPWDRRQ